MCRKKTPTSHTRARLFALHFPTRYSLFSTSIPKAVQFLLKGVPMDLLHKKAVRLYTLQLPSPHSPPTLGMARFLEVALTAESERAILAQSDLTLVNGYFFRFTANDAPPVIAVYASYLDQLEV